MPEGVDSESVPKIQDVLYLSLLYATQYVLIEESVETDRGYNHVNDEGERIDAPKVGEQCVQ